jgi:proteasome lid subunit RPN8/RPN11
VTSPIEADGVLRIPVNIEEQMIAHALREAPRECCGIFAGVGTEVTAIYELRNAARSGETRYDADRMDLLAAVRSMRALRTEMLAIYHSHPRDAAIPSQTDLRENYYGAMPRIIVSLLGETPDVRIWRLDQESYEELPWQRV